MGEEYIRQKMCGAKKRLTEQQARNKAQGMMANDPNGVVKAYECPFCHYWHVGRERDWDGLDRSRKRR